jgi:diguanylate cyclase (GGDEF)-like protein
MASVEMFRQVYRSIFTDYTTGIYNRAYLESVLVGKYADEPSLGCLFIDVDYLRTLNSRYGHVQTNKVLHHIAQTLQKIFPEVVRYAGDEFVALLPCNGRLVYLAELSRILVESQPLNLTHKTIPASISIGAAHRRPQEAIESLIERADAALLQAKARRNCVLSDRIPAV